MEVGRLARRIMVEELLLVVGIRTLPPLGRELRIIGLEKVIERV